MTDLVTGGTGFVGGAIVEQLLAAGRKVRVLARSTSRIDHLKDHGVEIAKGDVLDAASLKAAMAGVDTLYHAAAQYEVWTARPQEMLDTANAGTRNVLDAALAAGIRKVIHTSSAAALGLPKNKTVTEDQLEPGYLPDVYYRSKYESELIANSYIAKGLDVITLNPSNVYGPGDVSKPLGRSIIALLTGSLPAAWDAVFPIVYIDDVARAHLLAAKHGKPGERYLLVERNASYREFFTVVARLGNAKLPPFLPVGAALATAYAAEFASRHTGRMPLVSVMQVRSGTRGTRFDGSKAARELGLAYIPMEEGLDRTVNWYREKGLA
jgi:dihydroflavonol-4-reductase